MYVLVKAEQLKFSAIFVINCSNRILKLGMPLLDGCKTSSVFNSWILNTLKVVEKLI